MPKRSSKKRAAPSQTNGRSSKRSRKEEADSDPETQIDQVITIASSDNELLLNENEEDEEMKDILAQIAAQEESEKLARKLQNGPGPSAASGSGSKNTPIDLEDDEAMARMLAEQWAKEDALSEDEESEIKIIADPSNLAPKNKNFASTSNDTKHLYSSRKDNLTEYQGPLIEPEDALQPFKEVFTGTKECSKCKTKMGSPRGCVSTMI